MATLITEECINCGACEAECPNTAIYQGGVPWELNGVEHPPVSEDLFYIVPEKCTECVGFYDQEACAAVCPVDCCVPDPDIPETEDVLLARAKELHPEVAFEESFPSRFRVGEGETTAAAEAEPAATAAAVTAKPAAAAAKPAAAALSGAVEKPIAAPKMKPTPKPAPRPEKTFPDELSINFEDAAALLKVERGAKGSPLKWLVAFSQPLLGALPFKQKRALERAVADRRFFTAAGSTGLNAIHNMILYPLLLAALGAISKHLEVFSLQLNWYIFLGMMLASIEAIWRMREGFRACPADQIVYRAAVYGLPMGPVMAPLVALVKRPEQQGSVGQDGFSDPRFEDKLERERRYGEVYRLHEESNGYLLELEFPRRVPPSGIKEELGVPDDMPDYDYELMLQDGFFVVKGKVTEANVRKVATVSPAFPPDFTTRIKLPSRVAGFRHRFHDKNLEVALPKKV